MTVPEFQYFVAHPLVGTLRLHTQRRRLGWHVGGEGRIEIDATGGHTFRLDYDLD